MLLGADRATVDAQQPGGGRAQEPGEAAFGGQLRVQLGALVGRELVAAGGLLLKVGDEFVADVLVALGLLGVAAE